MIDYEKNNKKIMYIIHFNPELNEIYKLIKNNVDKK